MRGKKDMKTYECIKCSADIPIKRRYVAQHFADYCIACASAMDSAIKHIPSLVPTHKGAYQPVMNRKQLYDATCNPKNYDHDFSQQLKEV